MDNITFFLALWGAFLSTYLAIREIRKDKRSLKIILEFVHFYETRRLVITNVGHRPITIDQIALEIRDKRYGETDQVPQNTFWDKERELPELPMTLEDGKMIVFYLSDRVVEELRDVNKFLTVRVFDAEGNVYNKYSKGEYNPKFGYRTGVYKPPGFLKDRALRIKSWWMYRKQRR